MFPDRRQSTSLNSIHRPQTDDDARIPHTTTQSPSINGATLVINPSAATGSSNFLSGQTFASPSSLTDRRSSWGPYTPTISSLVSPQQHLSSPAIQPPSGLRNTNESVGLDDIDHVTRVVNMAVSDAHALALALQVATGSLPSVHQSADPASSITTLSDSVATSLDFENRGSPADHPLLEHVNQSPALNTSAGSLPSSIPTGISDSTLDRALQAKQYLSSRYAHIFADPGQYNPLRALRRRVAADNAAPPSRFTPKTPQPATFPYGRRNRLCVWEVDNAELLSRDPVPTTAMVASPSFGNSLHLSSNSLSFIRSANMPTPLIGEINTPLSAHSSQQSSIVSNRSSALNLLGTNIVPQELTKKAESSPINIVSMPGTVPFVSGSPSAILHGNEALLAKSGLPQTKPLSLESISPFTPYAAILSTGSPPNVSMKTADLQQRNPEQRGAFKDPMDAGIDPSSLWGGPNLPKFDAKGLSKSLGMVSLVPGKTIAGIDEVDQNITSLLECVRTTKNQLTTFRDNLAELADPSDQSSPLVSFRKNQLLTTGLEKWADTLASTDKVVHRAHEQLREIEDAGDEIAALIEDLEWAAGGEYLQTMKRLDDAIQGRSTARWRRDDTVLETAYTLLSYLLASLAFILWGVLLVIRVVRRITAIVTWPIWFILAQFRTRAAHDSEQTEGGDEDAIKRISLMGSTSMSWMSDAMAAASGEMINGFGSATDNRMTAQLERFINPEEWKSRIEQLFDVSAVLAPAQPSPTSTTAVID